MMASAYAYFYLFTQRKTIRMALKEREIDSQTKEEEEADDKI